MTRRGYSSSGRSVSDLANPPRGPVPSSRRPRPSARPQGAQEPAQDATEHEEEDSGRFIYSEPTQMARQTLSAHINDYNRTTRLGNGTAPSTMRGIYEGVVLFNTRERNVVLALDHAVETREDPAETVARIRQILR